MQISKIDTFSGHRGAIYSLENGMEDHLFFSAGADGWIVQWNLQKPDVGKVIAQVEGSVYSMNLDTNQEILWVAQNNEGIHGINLEDQSRLFSIKMESLSVFDMIQFHDQIWVAHNDGLISIVDIPTRSIVKHIKISQKSVRKFVIINENIIAVAFSDGFIRLIDNNYQLINQWKAHDNSVFSLDYNSQSSHLISVGRDAKIKKWDMTLENFIQKPAEVIGHIYTINDVSFSPDGQLLATASMDKTIKIWQSSDLKLLKVVDAARHGGHSNSVNKLIWTNFENQLVSGSDDKKISVWTIH
ncbi:WD40 repeat domain-containing protein [Aquirufa sp. ROCK2-A2]